jgi:Jacalin-like lectin domain
VLDPGEAVTSAELCSGQRDGRTRIFFASFQTSAGRSLAGGTRTNACTTLSAPAGWQLVGFHGRSGASVDKLGLVYAPR